MGAPKLNLPWGETTVLGHVLDILVSAGVSEIILVKGPIPIAIQDSWAGYPIKMVENQAGEEADMLGSLQSALRCICDTYRNEISLPLLIVLGDMPRIKAKTIQEVVFSYYSHRKSIVIPSIQMRRGHPWLIEQTLAKAILDLYPPATLKEFVNSHSEQIDYVTVDDPGILLDLDTPVDYENLKPA